MKMLLGIKWILFIQCNTLQSCTAIWWILKIICQLTWIFNSLQVIKKRMVQFELYHLNHAPFAFCWCYKFASWNNFFFWKKFVFSDETHFYTNCFVNLQNYSMWGNAVQEKPKCTVCPILFLKTKLSILLLSMMYAIKRMTDNIFFQ